MDRARFKSLDIILLKIYYNDKQVPGFEPGIIGLQPIALATWPYLQNFNKVLSKQGELKLTNCDNK